MEMYVRRGLTGHPYIGSGRHTYQVGVHTPKLGAGTIAQALVSPSVKCVSKATPTTPSMGLISSIKSAWAQRQPPPPLGPLLGHQ
jgi:hypothetical protein